MGIEKIDSNFAAKQVEAAGEKASYTLPCAPFDLYGVSFDEKNGRFVRMDLDVAERISTKVSHLAKHTSGGRVRFSTDSTFFGMTVTYDNFNRMSHMTLVASSGMLLLEEREDGGLDFILGVKPSYRSETGYTASVKLKGGKMRNYILYLPLYNFVNSIQVELDAGAKVAGGKKYREELPILYYGSSITQGGCASRPDTCYQAHISRWNNIDYINLGFSGNGRGEQAMAEYLGKIPCSLFVMDYDHNAPTPEHLEKTHFAFYETFRALQPDTPILMISMPDCDRIPEQAKERDAIIRKSYRKAKALGDENIYFLAGKTLFGKEDRVICTVDNVHPNDLGFSRMAKKIYQKMKQINPKFQ